MEYSARNPGFPAIFADPQRYPPSGKIELFFQTIAGFTRVSRPPVVDEQEAAPAARRRAGRRICSPRQPCTRLHSQYDHGSVSRATKIRREPLWMHPQDAQARGISEGSVVKVYSARGAISPGAPQRADFARVVDGAWYDPLIRLKRSLDKHGNPNVDRRSRQLAAAAPKAAGGVAPWRTPPPVTAFDPPIG